jgi:hypothetical protein
VGTSRDRQVCEQRAGLLRLRKAHLLPISENGERPEDLDPEGGKAHVHRLPTTVCGVKRSFLLLVLADS